MTAPLPVTVVGGYLGAGKTTLINHLLRNAGGRRLAVLVNEFGELAIDADLIEAEGDRMIALAGGCICCSFGDDLAGALRDMAALDPPPDAVIVEASGVAIPGAIAASLSLLPEVRQDAVVVLADAETVAARARDRYVGDTILRQLADADLVVLSKTDLVADLAPVRAFLADTAPRARVVEAARGEVAPDLLLDRPPGAAPVPTPHADALFDSVVLRPAGPVDARALAQALAEGDHGVVRAKGHVLDHDGDWHLVQVVGRRWQAQAVAREARQGVVAIGLRGRLDVADLSRRFGLTAA